MSYSVKRFPKYLATGIKVPEIPSKQPVLNIDLRDLAIENYPQNEYLCGLQGSFRGDH